MLPRPILPAPRRSVLKAAGGLAGILALGRAPAFAQTQPKKLIIAHIVPPPESGAVALKYFAAVRLTRLFWYYRTAARRSLPSVVSRIS